MRIAYAMSGSGRERAVMIACVTFETVKVTDPVRFYRCDRVHIIHYVKNTQKRSVFQEFYDRVCETILDDNRNVEIVEHSRESVNDFSLMLSRVLSIIEQEQAEGDCRIYVNISSGSPDYTAAAAIGSMMSENVIPFTVNSKGYSIGTEDEIRSAYYRDGRPVGLTSETYPPKALPTYAIDKPPEHLVKGLRVLRDLNSKKQRSKSSGIVPVLKDKGIWFREEPDYNQKQSDAVQYHRDFVSKWVERGWVVKNELTKKYEVTEEGEIILDTFYLEETDQT